MAKKKEATDSSDNVEPVIVSDSLESMFYSAEERGWFHPTVHAVMPGDVVEVPFDQYALLLQGQALGKEIVPDENGSPTLVEPEPLTVEQITKDVLAQRDRLLFEAGLRIAPLQDAVDLEEATAEETAKLKLWKQYRVSLNRIDQAAGYPQTVNWPEQPTG